MLAMREKKTEQRRARRGREGQRERDNRQ